MPFFIQAHLGAATAGKSIRVLGLIQRFSKSTTEARFKHPALEVSFCVLHWAEVHQNRAIMIKPIHFQRCEEVARLPAGHGPPARCRIFPISFIPNFFTVIVLVLLRPAQRPLSYFFSPPNSAFQGENMLIKWKNKF